MTHLSEAFHTMGESVCESVGERDQKMQIQCDMWLLPILEWFKQRPEQGVDLKLAVMCPFELIGAVSA